MPLTLGSIQHNNNNRDARHRRKISNCSTGFPVMLHGSVGGVFRSQGYCVSMYTLYSDLCIIIIYSYLTLLLLTYYNCNKFWCFTQFVICSYVCLLCAELMH